MVILKNDGEIAVDLHLRIGYTFKNQKIENKNCINKKPA
jgi:hypothetical protein